MPLTRAEFKRLKELYWLLSLWTQGELDATEEQVIELRQERDALHKKIDEA